MAQLVSDSWPGPLPHFLVVCGHMVLFHSWASVWHELPLVISTSVCLRHYNFPSSSSPKRPFVLFLSFTSSSEWEVRCPHPKVDLICPFSDLLASPLLGHCPLAHRLSGSHVHVGISWGGAFLTAIISLPREPSARARDWATACVTAVIPHSLPAPTSLLSTRPI